MAKIVFKNSDINDIILVIVVVIIIIITTASSPEQREWESTGNHFIIMCKGRTTSVQEHTVSAKRSVTATLCKMSHRLPSSMW